MAVYEITSSAKFAGKKKNLFCHVIKHPLALYKPYLKRYGPEDWSDILDADMIARAQESYAALRPRVRLFYRGGYLALSPKATSQLKDCRDFMALTDGYVETLNTSCVNSCGDPDKQRVQLELSDTGGEELNRVRAESDTLHVHIELLDPETNDVIQCSLYLWDDVSKLLIFAGAKKHAGEWLPPFLESGFKVTRPSLQRRFTEICIERMMAAHGNAIVEAHYNRRQEPCPDCQ